MVVVVFAEGEQEKNCRKSNYRMEHFTLVSNCFVLNKRVERVEDQMLIDCEMKRKEMKMKENEEKRTSQHKMYCSFVKFKHRPNVGHWDELEIDNSILFDSQTCRKKLFFTLDFI